MSKRATTSDRILENARKMFNLGGYASTTLAEIASSVRISQGNLTYHFPNKRDLAIKLEQKAQETMKIRWASKVEGPIAEDYMDHLVFAKRLTWNYRFLLRDYALFSDDPNWLENNPYMLSDFEELRHLLKRISDEGLFLDLPDFDFEVLARSLWINSRYWMDHLRELQGRELLGWADFERGLHHHFDLLGFFLSPGAKECFTSAKDTALRFLKRHGTDGEPGALLSS